jgi:hypothetical protein
VNLARLWSTGWKPALACAVLLTAVSVQVARAHIGFDAGESASVIWKGALGQNELTVAPGTWLRVRNLGRAMEPAAVERERAALQALKRRGFRIIALVEWPAESWAGGVRAGGGGRFPVDLREAWERSRALGRLYGGEVDCWEIGNEPDVSFLEDNAETYAAYLKACRAGLRVGAGAESPEKPCVLMAPLALPPGPYFERLWASGVGGATDGFNFHYYGYAEDFSDVYAQFRDAVEQGYLRPAIERENSAPTAAGGQNAQPVEESATLSGKDGGPTLREIRRLPVFLTEYGYGSMSIKAAVTREGRARQWRWFRDVGRQLEVARPEGALAFVLTPYAEQGLNEFGLIMPSASARRAGGFRPADFGMTEREPWMSSVGMKTPLGRVSPALAWLLREDAAAEGAGPAQAWRVRLDAARSETVALDFVARDGLEQRKGFHGYFARGIAIDGSAAGWGELVLYNFGDRAVSGVLKLGAGLSRGDGGPGEESIVLAPGERRVVTVRAQLPASVFRAVLSESVFEMTDGARGVLITTLWPDPARMQARLEVDLARGNGAKEEVIERLLARPRAGEEPGLRRDGRWLASVGTRVTEREGRWIFSVDAMPLEPLRPAMAELALPEDFQFRPGQLLEFSHRLAEGSADAEAWLDVYFRTDNGNLYQVWPRLRATRTPQGYAEAAENFTMAFYGRAKNPWRFRDNRPVALVFFMRPARLPAVYEIGHAAITRREAE